VNTPFLLQLLISFFVGGFFIALQTIVAERVSEKMRGIVLTIPSTIALGLFFIGVFESPENASAAAEFATAALAGPYVFMVAYALAARRHGIFWSLLFSTALWALFAVLIIQFPPSSFWQGVFMYFVPPTVLLYFIIIRFPAKSEITPKPFTAYQMFGREIACGFIVALSLFLSRRFNTDFGALRREIFNFSGAIGFFPGRARFYGVYVCYLSRLSYGGNNARNLRGVCRQFAHIPFVFGCGEERVISVAFYN